MTRRLVMEIAAGERECGECNFQLTYTGLYYYCRMFRCDGDFSNLDLISGRPQRCAACLKAEVPAKEGGNG